MPMFRWVLKGTLLVLLKEVCVILSSFDKFAGIALISVGNIVCDLSSQDLLILLSGRGRHLHRGLVPLKDTLEFIPVLYRQKVLFNVPIVRALP